MKVAAAFLIGCLIAAPVYAQTPPAPSNEEILLEGLSNVSVCLHANLFASAKLTAIIKRMQSEGADKLNDDGTKTLNSAADALNDINDISLIEKMIGRSLIERLVQEYNHTLEDLNETITPIVDATEKKMKDIFKNDEEFSEFNTHFMPKLDRCTDMIIDLSEKVKEMQEKTPEAK